MTRAGARGILGRMHRSIALSLLTLVGFACERGSSGGGGRGLNCPVEAGTFRVSYIEVSGDCGPIDAADVAAGGDWCTGVPMGCTGRRLCSADRCSIDIDYVCTLEDGSTVDNAGSARAITENELRATVTVAVSDPAGALLCESVYDVTWLRR